MRITSLMVLAALSLLLPGCGAGAGKNLALDESEDPPTIFCEPAGGMTLRFSDAEYAEGSGWLASYAVQVDTSAGTPIQVKLKTKTPAASGQRPTYVAEADGVALPSLQEVSGTKLIGFTVKEPGGVVLPHSGTIQLNIQTDLSYSPDGRQQLAKQTFTHEGKSYEITYDGYTWRQDGRLGGYAAHIVKAQ